MSCGISEVLSKKFSKLVTLNHSVHIHMWPPLPNDILFKKSSFHDFQFQYECFTTLKPTSTYIINHYFQFYTVSSKTINYKPSNPCPTNDTLSAAHQPPAVSLLHVSGPCNAVRKAVGRKASGKVATLAVTEGTWRDSVVTAFKTLMRIEHVETGFFVLNICELCMLQDAILTWPPPRKEREP